MSELKMLPPVIRFNTLMGNLFCNLRKLPTCKHSDRAIQGSLTWAGETAYMQAKDALEAKYKPVFPINPESPEHYEQYRQWVDNLTYLGDRFNHFLLLAGVDVFKMNRDGRYAPGGSIFSKNTV